MDREAIRLECLRLRFRHDHTIAHCVEDAKTLEAYVVGPEEDKPANLPVKLNAPNERKKSGNPDLFS